MEHTERNKQIKHSVFYTRDEDFHCEKHWLQNWYYSLADPTAVRYSVSEIDLMPFGSGIMSSSISSHGGKPRTRPNIHWSITPQSIPYFMECSRYPLSVNKSGWTVNIRMRAAKIIRELRSGKNVYEINAWNFSFANLKCTKDTSNISAATIWHMLVMAFIKKTQKWFCLLKSRSRQRQLSFICYICCGSMLTQVCN